MIKGKILLTGATGFIGSYLAHRFGQEGLHVIGITRRHPSPQVQSLLAGNNFQLIQAELSQDFLLPEGIDVIVHTAAQTPPSGVSVDAYIRDNVLATQNLVKYAREVAVSKFIYLSSVSVYGEVRMKVVDEVTPIVNPLPYGMTKYLGELLLRDNEKNFPSVALRLPGVLGKGARTPWLARVLNQALQGEDITIYNAEAYFNNVVYLPDLYNIIRTILKQKLNDFEAVTIGCAKPMSVEETVMFLLKELKSNSNIIKEKSDRISFTISIEKAERLFGYAPLALSEILRRYTAESMG